MKKGINVFSGCDGIGCLMLALKTQGVVINKYYASEILSNPIKVAMKNHPEIIQMGDILRWREWDIDWASIDVLGFGFPCQAFSLTGKKKGLKDIMARKVFFACIEIYYRVKDLNPNVQVIFENVKMTKENRKAISEYIGFYPTFLNSSLVSAQNRPRNYWTSIPGVIPPPNDCGYKLTDIVPGAVAVGSHGRDTGIKKSDGSVKWAAKDTFNKKNKSYCLTRNNGYCKYVKDGVKLKFTAAECEQLQTLPIGYTDVEGITQGERIEMIGNAWTVNMIRYLITLLPEYPKWDKVNETYDLIREYSFHARKWTKKDYDHAREVLGKNN